MSTQLATINLDDLRSEIRDCRQVQSWANGTRSRWVGDLEDLLDAIESEESPETITNLAAAAKAHQVDLATKVARRLVHVDEIADHIRRHEDLTDTQETELAAITDVAELVAWMRTNDITIDNAVNGDRDGWTIDATQAVAYASCRSWVQDDAEWVEVDLVTGEATAR